MHNQFAGEFYRRRAWRNCRDQYFRARNGLCERCAAMGKIVPGTEVHHKIHLTPENLNDPSITLNWANLELLCKPCHDAEHEREAQLTRTDSSGHVEL